MPLHTHKEYRYEVYHKYRICCLGRPRRKLKQPYSEKDLPDCVQYLIIGTGAAGWGAYRAIMQHDKYAKVQYTTHEILHDSYYSRIPTKYPAAILVVLGTMIKLI